MIFEMVRPRRPKELSPLTHIAWHVIEAGYYGQLLWKTNHGEACRKALKMGFKIASETGIHIYDFMLYMNQISLCLCMGEISVAKRHLKELSPLLDRNQCLNVSHYHYLASWAEWLEGNHGAALEHAESSVEIARRLGGPFHEAFTLNALAHVLYASGRGDKAARVLSRSLQISRGMNGRLLLYRGLLLKAHMEIEKGDAGACTGTLRKALSIGREQNYLIFSWWDREIMMRLCTKALDAGIEVEYVQRLIRERRLPIDPVALDIGNWPYKLKIYTLGCFEVVKDEIPISSTGKIQRKPIELLKVIIAHGGQKVRNGLIYDALWPEADEWAAHSAFTTLLSRLYSLTGHEAILHQQGQLTLNPQFCWVDIWALERLLNQAEKTDQANPLQECLMEKILNLYQGPFLKGEEMPWAYSTRERLASKFVRYLRKRGRYLEQRGEYEQAITLHLKGLEADPMSEGHYRCLMACYHALGRRAEAIATYQRCCKTLLTLQGIEPSRETEALYQKICFSKKI